VGLAAGASLGLDFAKIMARQFERLPQTQRQAFAAPQAPAESELTRANAQAQADARNTQASERQAQDQQDRHAQSAERANDASQQPQDTQTHSQVSQRASKKPDNGNASPNSDASAADMAVAASAPVPAPVLPTPASAEVRAQALKGNAYLKDVGLPSSDASHTALRTLELSPHMRIITDPRKAPSPESLTAFAKSMGLDEAAIQKLMGDATQDLPAGAVPTSGVSTEGSPQLNAALNNPAAQLADKLQNSANPALATAAALTPSSITSDAATQAANAGHAVQPNLGDALQGLAPTDLASIQHMEINVLPATLANTGLNGLSVKTASAIPSTASVLSMLGGSLNEHDINNLVANFEAGAAGGESSTSQGGSDSGAGSFAQNMPRPVPNPGGATHSAQNTSQVHMSEVYDQLSDKMATEMAARMHKQLSDGEWKMKFGLRPANLGGVEIQLEMKDGKLNAMIQADNPLTRDLLQNSSQRLRDALENFGIQAGQVQIGQDSRGTQQNPSRDASKQAQVGDNSISQVKGSDSTSGDVTASVKASASLLDLYA
jgi:flagellar hook-length control protein FliK